MKKTKKTIAIAAALTAAASGLAACTPPWAPQQTVYGPPPDAMTSTAATSADTSAADTSKNTAAETVRETEAPAESAAETVTEETTTRLETTTTVSAEPVTSASVTDEPVEDVYGPPPDFDESEPEDIIPDDEGLKIPLVYGPPTDYKE